MKRIVLLRIRIFIQKLSTTWIKSANHYEGANKLFTIGNEAKI